MIANILTIMSNGAPVLPPMDAETGTYCLHYTEAGVLKGGYTVLNDAPADPNTCIVQVMCSDTVFAQMIDDPAFDIQWWEEVIEDASI